MSIEPRLEVIYMWQPIILNGTLDADSGKVLTPYRSLNHLRVLDAARRLGLAQIRVCNGPSPLQLKLSLHIGALLSALWSNRCLS